MRISEVLLSDGGNDAIQYIEMSNPSGDTFPGTYYLGIYDADGEPIGTVSLGAPTKPLMLISTTEADTAFDVEGDDELTVTLPAAGQVCFERVPSSRIACTSWGCIDTAVTGAYDTTEGAPPPDSQALQRQADGTYDIGDPTPDAANAAGSSDPACPTDPDAGPSDIDAGTDGDIDAGPNDPDAGGGSGDGGDGDDDDSGCGCGCGASGPRSATGGLLVLGLFLVAGRVRRFRGRGTRT